jgi:hypothetical protein
MRVPEHKFYDENDDDSEKDGAGDGDVGDDAVTGGGA